MPNVLLRHQFAFPEHRPSGQQGAEPEPRRESGGLAEEVLMLENWTETTALRIAPVDKHLSVYRCPATEHELFLT